MEQKYYLRGCCVVLATRQQCLTARHSFTPRAAVDYEGLGDFDKGLLNSTTPDKNHVITIIFTFPAQHAQSPVASVHKSSSLARGTLHLCISGAH